MRCNAEFFAEEVTEAVVAVVVSCGECGKIHVGVDIFVDLVEDFPPVDRVFLLVGRILQTRCRENDLGKAGLDEGRARTVLLECQTAQLLQKREELAARIGKQTLAEGDPFDLKGKMRPDRFARIRVDLVVRCALTVIGEGAWGVGIFLVADVRHARARQKIGELVVGVNLRVRFVGDQMLVATNAREGGDQHGASFLRCFFQYSTARTKNQVLQPKNKKITAEKR